MGMLFGALWAARSISRRPLWTPNWPGWGDLEAKGLNFARFRYPFLTYVGSFWEVVSGKWDPYETCAGMSGLHVCPSLQSRFKGLFRHFFEEVAQERSKDKKQLQEAPK